MRTETLERERGREREGAADKILTQGNRHLKTSDMQCISNIPQRQQVQGETAAACKHLCGRR